MPIASLFFLNLRMSVFLTSEVFLICRLVNGGTPGHKYVETMEFHCSISVSVLHAFHLTSL